MVDPVAVAVRYERFYMRGATLPPSDVFMGGGTSQPTFVWREPLYKPFNLHRSSTLEFHKIICKVINF